METFTYNPIGRVKSPFKDRNHAPKFYTESGDVTAQIDILPQYKDALLGIEPGMELLVIFAFHLLHETALQVKKRGTGPVTGVFATRSPRRPNPIGVSVIRVTDVKDTTITFTGVDMLDGTPVLDIKKQA